MSWSNVALGSGRAWHESEKAGESLQRPTEEQGATSKTSETGSLSRGVVLIGEEAALTVSKTGVSGDETLKDSNSVII